MRADPTTRARIRLGELVTQLRDDSAAVADPCTRALFATTADLLAALEDAFADAQARTVAEPNTGPMSVPPGRD